MAFFVSLFLILLGGHPEWSHHLSGDVSYYYSIASYYFANHTLLGFTQTLLYPPAANLFFLSLPSFSFNSFLVSLFLVNSFLIIVLSWLYRRVATKEARWQLLSLILFAGPLVIFRFDLFIILLLVLSILSFQKERYSLSGFLLGTAAAAKIFPIIILPYYLFLLLNKRTPLIKVTVSFIIALAIWSLTYIGVTGAEPSSILAGFNFNLTKLVHIESIPGSILTITTFLQYGKILPIEFANGVWGLPFYYTFGHPRIFQYLPAAALGLVYLLFFLFRRKFPAKLDIRAIVLLILVLICTTQVLSPQYLLWPIFLLPLLTTSDRWNLFLSALILILTQDVYPVHYDALIFPFYLGGGQYSEIFLVLTLRNLLVLVLTGRIAACVFRRGR